MIEIFKKGQIVPRRLKNVICSDRKAQHCVTFGCDVARDGNSYTSLSSGPVFYVRSVKRRMNNGTYKRVRLLIKDTYITGSTGVQYEC